MYSDLMVTRKRVTAMGGTCLAASDLCNHQMGAALDASGIALHEALQLIARWRPDHAGAARWLLCRILDTTDAAVPVWPDTFASLGAVGIHVGDTVGNQTHLVPAQAVLLLGGVGPYHVVMGAQSVLIVLHPEADVTVHNMPSAAEPPGVDLGRYVFSRRGAPVKMDDQTIEAGRIALKMEPGGQWYFHEGLW